MILTNACFSVIPFVRINLSKGQLVTAIPVTVKNGDSPPESLNTVKGPIITGNIINRSNKLSCQINGNNNCMNVANNSNRQSLYITNDSNFNGHQLSQGYLQCNHPQINICAPGESNQLTLLNSKKSLLISNDNANLGNNFNISQVGIDEPPHNKSTFDKEKYYTSQNLLKECNRKVMNNLMRNRIQPENFESTATPSNCRIHEDNSTVNNLNQYYNELHINNNNNNDYSNNFNNYNNSSTYDGNQKYLLTPKDQQESHQYRHQQYRHYMATNSDKVCHYYRCNSDTSSANTPPQPLNTIDKIAIQHNLFDQKDPPIDERLKIFTNLTVDSKITSDTSDAVFSILPETPSSSTLAPMPPPPPPPPPPQSGTPLQIIPNANSVYTSVPYSRTTTTSNSGCASKDNVNSYIQFAASLQANNNNKVIKDGNHTKSTGKLE